MENVSICLISSLLILFMYRREMAERTNLDLISEIEFKANEWPGYVLMRHHVGRSFGGRVQRCLHYGFR